METRKFSGKWITDDVFCDLAPRNVFHRQLEKFDLPADENADSHVLFLKKFILEKTPDNAVAYISADDHYKLYINGKFVCQGPSPSYRSGYNYNEVDVTEYLATGENVIAVHTYYQGLINRVWVSGDNCHGLIMDVIVDGTLAVKSDESFLTHRHAGFSPLGIVGYGTQFCERYDSRAAEDGFQFPNFDDRGWEHAKERKYVDYELRPQSTKRAMIRLRFSPLLPCFADLRGAAKKRGYAILYSTKALGRVCSKRRRP